jgi:uncharacterized membrane protein (DUF373 family)
VLLQKIHRSLKSVLLIFLVFCVLLLCVFTFWVPCCDFRIQTMVGSFFTSMLFVRCLMYYKRYLCCNTKWTIHRNWQRMSHKTKNKNQTKTSKKRTQYALDTIIRKPTQITFIRHQPSYFISIVNTRLIFFANEVTLIHENQAANFSTTFNCLSCNINE